MNTQLRVSFDEVFKTPVGDELDSMIGKMIGDETPLFYSTRDHAALNLIEWLRQQGYLVTVKWMPDGYNFMAGNDGPELPSWRRVCELMYMPMDTHESTRRRIHLNPVGKGDTMAEAVCRAALKAVHDWFRFE